MFSVTLRVVSVFLIILLGFVAFKRGMISRQDSKLLSTVMMNIAAPCLTLYTVSSNRITPETLHIVEVGFLATGLIYASATLVNFLLTRTVIRPGREDFGMYWVESTFSNSGFLCFPICLAVFGQEAFFYSMITNLLVTLLMYTVGIAQVCYGGAEDGPGMNWKGLLKNLMSPPTLAAIVGLGMFLADIQLPGFLMDTCQTVGNMLVPLSMLVIGVQLGDSKLGNMLTNWRYMLYSAIKLGFWPVVAFIACTTFHVPPIIVVTVTLTQAMPAGSLPVVFAEQYGRNSKLGAELVFISTLLSIVTIPIACIFLTQYLQGAM